MGKEKLYRLPPLKRSQLDSLISWASQAQTKVAEKYGEAKTDDEKTFYAKRIDECAELHELLGKPLDADTSEDPEPEEDESEDEDTGL